MGLSANFNRGCVFMEASTSSVREANAIRGMIKSCGGKVISTSGLHFSVVFFKNEDADEFLVRLKPYAPTIKEGHEKL